MTIGHIRTAVRVAVAAAAVSGLAGLLAAHPSAAPQRDLRERHLVISVLDKSGKPAAGLTPADLAIREDGVVREVLRVEPAADPMQVMLLVDTSATTQAAIPDLRKGLASLVTAILAKRSDSQIGVMSFGERPTRDAGLTTSEVTLQRAIGRLFARPGGGSYLLEAITEAVKDLKKLKAARPVIVAYADMASPEFSAESDRQIADALKDAGVELWAIVLQTGAVSSSSDAERNRSTVLGDVTTASGGTRETVLTHTALAPKFEELAGRLTSQYVVTYNRPDSLVPPSRLDVTLKREGLRLLAPRWAGQ